MGPSTIYHCGGCDTTLPNEGVYNAHVRGLTREFRCPRCPKKFTSPCAFEVHNKRMHNGKAGTKVPPWTPESNQQCPVTGSGQSHLSTRAPRLPPQKRWMPPGVLPRRVKSAAWDSITSVSTQSSMIGSDLITTVPSSPPQSKVVEGDLIEFSDSSGDENAGNGIAVVEEEEDDFKKFMELAAAFQAQVASRRRSELVDNTTIQRQTQSPVPSKAYPVPPISTDEIEPLKPASANADTAPPPRSTIRCTECKVLFSSHAGLLQHQTSTEHNYCRLCDAFFSDSKNRQDHYDHIHSFSCFNCAATFVSTETLRDHQRDSKHGYCKECDCFFSKKRSQDSHVAKIHGIDSISGAKSPRVDSNLDDAKYCTQCDERLERGETLADHSAKSHPYRCSEADCSFAAPKYAHLVRHQREEKHNFCDPCDRLFDSKAALDEHRNNDRMHTNASTTGGEVIQGEDGVGNLEGNSDNSDLEGE